ncbi:MAG: hypothetical protein ACQSGP_06475 [Frankia sp.]
MGYPDVTYLFLPRLASGALGVARRDNGELVQPSPGLLRAMLVAAGWRGDPIQVWAPGGSMGAWNDPDVDENAAYSTLEAQLSEAANHLRAEFWAPGPGIDQELVEGQLRTVADPGVNRPYEWRPQLPVTRRGELTPPVFMVHHPNGGLRPRAVMGQALTNADPVIWESGLASVSLADYLDQLPLLRALARANNGIFEVVLPRHDGGLGIVRSNGRRVRLDHLAFERFLREFGWRNGGVTLDVRVWIEGGSGRAEATLAAFAAAAGVEVLVLDGSSHGIFDGPDGQLQSVDAAGQPTRWRVLGELASRGLSRWESVDGVARLRRDDAVVSTSTGVSGTSAAGYGATVGRAGEPRGRDDVFEVRGFAVRGNSAGEPEFAVERLDGTSYTRSPAEMVEFLEQHGWRRGQQPLVVIERLDGGDGSDSGELTALRQEAWRRVGAEAGAFVFAPVPGSDVLIEPGLHVAVAGPTGAWEALHVPDGQPVALVTDPAGRLWASDSPAWLPMVDNGLAAPTAQMVLDRRARYAAQHLNYPAGAFPLDLPLLPGGRLGVTFGDGEVRSVDEVGADQVVAAVAARNAPFGTVVLWTLPPVLIADYQVFMRDVENLAAAFGRPVVHIMHEMDPFGSHYVPGGRSGGPESSGPSLGTVAPPLVTELPGYLSVNDSGQLVESRTDQRVLSYDNNAFLFGLAGADDMPEDVQAEITEWDEQLHGMPASRSGLPLVVVHTTYGGEPSWRPDRLVPVVARDVVNALTGRTGPVRIVTTRAGQVTEHLEELAREISAWLGGEPVYVGHDAIYIPDLQDIAASSWVPVVDEDTAPGAPSLDYVRDSATGALVPLDSGFEFPESDASEWYLAGASITDLLVVPLIDADGIYGVDLTGRMVAEPSVEPPADSLADSPVSGRLPGGFLVVADGGPDVVVGQHETVGALRIPPEQLAAIVLAYAPRDFTGAVYLGVARLDEAPGASAPRSRGIGYAALVRAELGWLVFATAESEPEYTDSSIWQEAPRLVWVPLIGQSAAGGMNLWSEDLRWGSSEVAMEIIHDTDLSRARGAFPIVIGAMDDGRLALRDPDGDLEPVAPRPLARLLRAEMDRLNVDPDQPLDIQSYNDSPQAGFPARSSRFLDELEAHLLDMPADRPAQTARAVPSYQGPGNVVRLGSGRYGRVMPVPHGIPNDEEGLVTAVLYSAALQYPESDLAELYRLLAVAPGPVARAIRHELGNIVTVLGTAPVGSGLRPGVEVLVGLLSDDEVELLIPAEQWDGRELRDIVAEALTAGVDHPMWDAVEGLPHGSVRERRRARVVLAVRDLAQGLGRMPSVGEVAVAALRGDGPYDGVLAGIFGREIIPGLLGVPVGWVSGEPDPIGDGAADVVRVYEHPDWNTPLSRYHAIEPLRRELSVAPVEDADSEVSEETVGDAVVPVRQEPSGLPVVEANSRTSEETAANVVVGARRILRDRLDRLWPPPPYSPDADPPGSARPADPVASVSPVAPVSSVASVSPTVPVNPTDSSSSVASGSSVDLVGAGRSAGSVQPPDSVGRSGVEDGRSLPVGGRQLGEIRADGRNYWVIQIPGDGSCYFSALLVSAQDQVPGSPVARLTEAELREHVYAWFTGPAGEEIRNNLDSAALGGGPAGVVRELAQGLGLGGLRYVLGRSAPLYARGEAAHLRRELEVAVDRNPTGAEWNRLLRVSPVLAGLGRPGELSGMRVSELVARAIGDGSWWDTPFFDLVPEIVARATDLDVVVVRTTGTGGVAQANHLHPADVGAPRDSVYVQHNGVDHYQAMEVNPVVPVMAGIAGEFAVRVRPEQGLVAADGMAELANGLVGQPYVTSVFLPRLDDGALAVVRRAGGEPVRLTSDVLRDMLSEAGWRGGPVQVWASVGSVVGSANWWVELARAAQRDEALRAQLEAFAWDLRTEFWFPSEGVTQQMVDGRLTARDGMGGSWLLVRPDAWDDPSAPPAEERPGGLTPPVWLTSNEDGQLVPGRVRGPVVWNSGLASLKLADYLNERNFLEALARTDSGIFEVVLSPYAGGVGMVRDNVLIVRFRDEAPGLRRRNDLRPTFAQFLEGNGWRDAAGNHRDMRVWVAGGSGPGSSEPMLLHFARSTGVEVLLLDGSSEGEVEERSGDSTASVSQVRSIDAQGQPTPWRVLGELADQDMSKWVSQDGVARLRDDELVVRTSTGLTATSTQWYLQTVRDGYLETVRGAPDLAARDDVYEVRGLEVRRNDVGEPEFVVQRLNGTSRLLSPAALPAYLEDHGWRPGQPLVVAEDLRTAGVGQGGGSGARYALTWDAWEQVGVAADVVVFAPPSGVDVARSGSHAALEYTGEFESWEVLHEPAGRPVGLVTDPVRRLWAPDAPAWLPMAANGLAAPTLEMVRVNELPYTAADSGSSGGAFALDLPVLEDGRLGVAMGDGSERSLEAVGVAEVVAAVRAAQRAPFTMVVLWATAPADSTAYEAFARDTERLAAAIGRPIIRARPGVNPLSGDLAGSVRRLTNALPLPDDGSSGEDSVGEDSVGEDSGGEDSAANRQDGAAGRAELEIIFPPAQRHRPAGGR